MAKGRVDFYIPDQAWGLELLRDGDKLAQHSGRFSQSESYATERRIHYPGLSYHASYASA